jgi:hypothetical protein
MTIKSICSNLLSLVGKSCNIIKTNEEAAVEAQSTLILTTAGCAFGFFGRAAVMLSTSRFSIPSLLMYGLIGFGAGIATSSPAIYSFFSKMKTRETI